ncbi:MAG: FHA domain-containing protein [Planctomycetota bacterium]
MLRVSITNPEGEDFQVLVEGESAVIGRSPEVDITVPNALVSARHLRIDAGAVVQDLRSKNGSWSRGSRLQGPVLVEGEAIVLGPDPDRSPAVRVEVLDPDGLSETERGGLTVVPRSAGNAAGEAAGRPTSRNGRWDATLAHPLTKPATAGAIGEGDQAFVIDACLQSLRSLESLMQPIEESTAHDPGRTSVDSPVLEAVEAALARSGDQRARQDLLDVLALQRRRIRDRYYAYRRASTRLVEEIRDQSLAEADLSGRAGVPVWKRALGLRWRHLWHRLRERMDAYDRRTIERRLDDLAQQSAVEGSSASGSRR